jgi:hypothetical protein
MMRDEERQEAGFLARQTRAGMTNKERAAPFVTLARDCRANGPASSLWVFAPSRRWSRSKNHRVEACGTQALVLPDVQSAANELDAAMKIS